MDLAETAAVGVEKKVKIMELKQNITCLPMLVSLYFVKAFLAFVYKAALEILCSV